ncbi:kinase-like protein [Coprinopsis marcescibilis]|uniref:Kinase-like protein n=1 Tax=Coprinopsis marcescibilis TaxID=230819 RepID=A0A5C3KK90_COPMA|nr:kinase-like protein [Coprinopsis marcescibilis]
MHSGQATSQAWSNFASSYPLGHVAELRNSSAVIKENNVGISSSTELSGYDSPPEPEPDEEQMLSAALVEAEPFDVPDHSYHPIPTHVAAVTEVSSSPAALFLSAFMGSKPEPAPLPDDEGQQVAGYTLGAIVGFGAFSTIRKAFSATGGVVAIKIIRRADLVRTGHAAEERKKMQREAEIWSSLSHEHILPLFSVVHTSYADYFITIYCPAGSLYDILKRDGNPALLQDDAGMMFRQVVRGLRYLHEVALLVHRDIKLENVLVDETGVCRIGDFGLSVKIGDIGDDEARCGDQHEHTHDAIFGDRMAPHRSMSMSVPSSKRVTRVGSSLNAAVARHNSTRHRSATSAQTSHVHEPGSLPYAAPELLLPQTSEINLSHPSQDIWALGVLLYALLTGHLPFNDSFEPRLQMKILNGSYEIPDGIGKGAEGILNGCLERNHTRRWSIAMVDEVSWGVGWGSAGDGATPEESQEDLLAHAHPPHSAPACPEPILESDDEDWQHEEQYPRSAIEAASRRSASRNQRSLSRAPINPGGRSASRHSRASSPHRGVRSYYLGSAGASVEHSPVTTPFYEDGAPSRSRSQSHHRGRRANKRSYFASRSPSPSIVPSTPIDFNSQLLSRLSLQEPSDDLHLDSDALPRGRARFCLAEQEAFDEDDETNGGDGLDNLGASGKGNPLLPRRSAPSIDRAYIRRGREDSQTSSEDRSPEPSQRPSKKHLSLSWSLEETFSPKSRSGSTPPVSAKSWELYRTKASLHVPRNQPQDMFLGTYTPGTPPIPISRSRSVDCAPPQRPPGSIDPSAL